MCGCPLKLQGGGIEEVTTNHNVTEETTVDKNEDLMSPEITRDGQWHIMVLDMTQSDTFTAASDGNYYAKHARIDMINGSYGSDTYIDIAYLGLTDELTDLDELVKNAATVTLVDANGATTRLDSN